MNEFSELPRIPVFRPAIGEEEIAEVVATLRSGWLGCGPKTAALEAEFRAFTAANHAVATASGTAALMAALVALGTGPDDEVIVPSFTWPSIFQVLRILGACPVFADIEPKYLTLDPEDVRRRITQSTRGIVAVHHGGQLADIDGLHEVASKAGLWLIDDAAHAAGSVAADGRRVGTLGTMTCFSFSAVKNIAAGDGGMVTTADPELARRSREFISLGLNGNTHDRYRSKRRRPSTYAITGLGQTLHLNDVLASLAIVQLRRLEELNKARAVRVAAYMRALEGADSFQFLRPRPGTVPSHHMFTVLLPDRDGFVEFMASRGISVGVHYPPIHRFPVAAPWAHPLPVTEDVAARTATLPLYPTMTDEEQDRVIAAILAWTGRPRGHAMAAAVR